MISLIFLSRIYLLYSPGGEGDVEKLDSAVVRLRGDLRARDREGECRGSLPGHPSVELYVVLVPLEAVKRLPRQVVVALQLNCLRNLYVEYNHQPPVIWSVKSFLPEDGG